MDEYMPALLTSPLKAAQSIDTGRDHSPHLRTVRHIGGNGQRPAALGQDGIDRGLRCLQIGGSHPMALLRQ